MIHSNLMNFFEKVAFGAVAVVKESVAAGRPVGVHCTAGLGRSGTMAAAYEEKTAHFVS